MMARVNKIRLIRAIVFIGAVSASVFHFIINKTILGYSYPYDTFLCINTIRFTDYFNYYSSTCELNPYFTKFWLHSNYYPFMNVFMYPFTLIPWEISMVLYFSIFILFLLYFNYSYLKTESKSETFINIIILSFLTYPVLFLLDRANLEGWIFIFIGASVLMYYKEKYLLSAIFVALATSMKGFPAVFLLMFIADKRYREAMISLLIVVALTFISLLFHHGGYFQNLAFVMNGFNLDADRVFKQVTDYSNNFVQRGVSLFTFIKVMFNTNHMLDFLKVDTLLKVYVKVILVITGFLTFHIVFIEKVLWRRVAIMVLMILLFPHISADYKLIHLLIPMFLFIKYNNNTRHDLLYCLLFGLLLIPKGYYFFSNMVSDVGNDVSIAIPLNVLLLLFFMGFLVYEGLFSKGRPSIKAEFKEHYAAFKSQVVLMPPKNADLVRGNGK
jgi:hypothetical protein